MFIKKRFTRAIRTVVYTLLIFLILGVVFFMVSFTIDRNEDEAVKTNTVNHENIITHVEKTIITSKLKMVSSDLLYIHDTLTIAFDESDFDELKKEWLAFSNRKKYYDQIRYININGDEVIRINFDKDHPYIVLNTSLQNKKDRYYFTESISLNKSQLYISELDLNIENGEIEIPYKPVIRFAMPVYDSSEQLKGIVILNYLANDLLNQINEIAVTSYGNIFLLNSDGYWIYNNDNKSTEWAFMFDKASENSFSNKYSADWLQMQHNRSDSFVSENGAFTYQTTLTDNSIILGEDEYYYINGMKSWKVVSYIPANSSLGNMFTESLIDCAFSVISEYYYVYLMTSFISFIIAYFIASNIQKREQIKYFSEFDSMTNVYNRRAGYEKLNYIYANKKSSKNECAVSICFIDVNGLKQVNDNLGHEAGDELILTVINEIKKNIRENDFIARLGGDEFLVVFAHANIDTAENIWQRIKSGLDYINKNENRKYVVSASHGIEAFDCKSTKEFDQLINIADEKMYAEKKIIKKSLQIIRQNS